MNWEEEDLSINKKGFLLSDACVGVLIVSLCAVIVSNILYAHTHTFESLKQTEDEMEVQMETVIERNVICAGCEEDLPS